MTYILANAPASICQQPQLRAYQGQHWIRKQGSLYGTERLVTMRQPFVLKKVKRSTTKKIVTPCSFREKYHTFRTQHATQGVDTREHLAAPAGGRGGEARQPHRPPTSISEAAQSTPGTAEVLIDKSTETATGSCRHFCRLVTKRQPFVLKKVKGKQLKRLSHPAPFYIHIYIYIYICASG